MISINDLKTESLSKFLLLFGIAIIWFGYSEIKSNSEQIDKNSEIVSESLKNTQFYLFKSYFEDQKILTEIDTIKMENERLNYLTKRMHKEKDVDTVQAITLFLRVAHIDTTIPMIKARTRFLVNKMDSLQPALRNEDGNMQTVKSLIFKRIEKLTLYNSLFRLLICIGFIISGVGFFMWSKESKK